MPTETVYGLAADAENDAAVAQIFTAKGRPADHPLIVHVANAIAATHFASDIPDFAQALMAAFWPGPLTLILPRRPGIAAAAAGGHASIGLRCPSHPVAQALLQSLINWGQITINSVNVEPAIAGANPAIAGANPVIASANPAIASANPAIASANPVIASANPAIAGANPVIASVARQSMHSEALACRVADAPRHDDKLVWGVAAPSANQFGRVSPTTAAHVQGEFGDDLLILDGGPCRVGIESTIIDCTRGQPVLLRPGAITPAQVQTVCGLKVLLKDELSALAAPAPKASGTLESHYAPRARVRLMDAAALQLALAELDRHSDPVPGALTDAAGAPGHPAIAVWSRAVMGVPKDQVLQLPMPQDAPCAAQQLFAVLRNFDAQGVGQIWIEAPPGTSDWDGVRDRLQRAAC